MRYSAQDVLDYLDGNLAVPDDGFNSVIEGFENDNDNKLEPQLLSQEPNYEEPVSHLVF